MNRLFQTKIPLYIIYNPYKIYNIKIYKNKIFIKEYISLINLHVYIYIYISDTKHTIETQYTGSVSTSYHQAHNLYSN